MKSTYILQLDEKSFCPKCGKPVDLLATIELFHKKPWFYICWACHHVAQVGVGPVEREGHSETDK